MSTGLSQAISSTTVNILFDDYVIGELQSFSVTEDFGISEVYGIGSPIPSFMPGMFIGTAHARKGFIDPNAFFTKFQPFGYKTESNLSSGIKYLVDSFANFLKNSSQASTLNDSVIRYALSNTVGQSFVYPADNERRTTILFFDIKYAYNAVSSGGIEKKIINIYKDCVINSRKTAVDASNVIILEDLTIKFRQRI
jgi:hypothetical protein